MNFVKAWIFAVWGLCWCNICSDSTNDCTQFLQKICAQRFSHTGHTGVVHFIFSWTAFVTGVFDRFWEVPECFGAASTAVQLSAFVGMYALVWLVDTRATCFRQIVIVNATCKQPLLGLPRWLRRWLLRKNDRLAVCGRRTEESDGVIIWFEREKCLFRHYDWWKTCGILDRWEYTLFPATNLDAHISAHYAAWQGHWYWWSRARRCGSGHGQSSCMARGRDMDWPNYPNPLSWQSRYAWNETQRPTTEINGGCSVYRIWARAWLAFWRQEWHLDFAGLVLGQHESLWALCRMANSWSGAAPPRPVQGLNELSWRARTREIASLWRPESRRSLFGRSVVCQFVAFVMAKGTQKNQLCMATWANASCFHLGSWWQTTLHLWRSWWQQTAVRHLGLWCWDETVERVQGSREGHMAIGNFCSCMGGERSREDTVLGGAVARQWKL